ncbi:MAG TPA: hypothetical protein DCS63_11085 [Elusimicrobia bacterium]|nr:hypothetical protein [Elusimicrobiota bacterium]
MKTTTILFLAAGLLVPPAHASAASAGNAAGQILKLGAGARYAALGDTGAAYSGDSSALFWNPAGLGFVDRCSVFTGHSRWFEEVAYSAVSAACPAGLGVFAAGWQYLDYGSMDSLDKTGSVDGDLNPSDRVVSAAWGFKAGKTLAFGVAAKNLSMKLGGRASAYAADAGMIARFSRITLGAALKNSGGGIKFNGRSEDLPQTLKIGAQAALNAVTLALDVNSSRDGAWLSGGAEYILPQNPAAAPIMFRAGYSTRLRTQGYNFTLGGGVRERSWALDYAFVPYGNLGITHHFSISYFFSRSGAGVAPKPVDRTKPFVNRPGAQSGDFILIHSEKAPPGWKAP